MFDNYDIVVRWPKSHWSGDGLTQWFSASLETGFQNRKLSLFSFHLWLLGFEIIDFCMKRK